MNRATVAVPDHASHLGPRPIHSIPEVPGRRRKGGVSHLSAGRRSAGRATAARTMGTVMVGHNCRGPNDTAFGVFRAVSLDGWSLGPHHGAAPRRADPGQKQDPAKSRFSRRRLPCSRGLGAGAPPGFGKRAFKQRCVPLAPSLDRACPALRRGAGVGLTHTPVLGRIVSTPEFP